MTAFEQDMVQRAMLYFEVQRGAAVESFLKPWKTWSRPRTVMLMH